MSQSSTETETTTTTAIQKPNDNKLNYQEVIRSFGHVINVFLFLDFIKQT